MSFADDLTKMTGAMKPVDTTKPATAHGWPLGKPKPFMNGECNHQAKLTADDVREIRRLRAAGEAMAEIARRFGVTYQNVYQIEKGKSWGWLE